MDCLRESSCKHRALSLPPGASCVNARSHANDERREATERDKLAEERRTLAVVFFVGVPATGI